MRREQRNALNATRGVSHIWNRVCGVHVRVVADMGILDDGNAEEPEFLGANVSLSLPVSCRDSGSAEPGMFGADDTDISVGVRKCAAVFHCHDVAGDRKSVEAVRWVRRARDQQI